MTRWSFVLVAIGCGITTLGAYVAGGTTVNCSRVEASTPETASAKERRPAVAVCVVRTTRWLGRQTTSEQTYARVTDADSLTGRRSGVFQLIADGTPVAEVAGGDDYARRAVGRVKTWFEGEAVTPLTIDFSDWGFGFAAMGFGALWFGVLTLMARAARLASGQR